MLVLPGNYLWKFLNYWLWIITYDSSGNIDAGDGCWKQNVLVTTSTFRSSLTSKSSHQHLQIATNFKSISTNGFRLWRTLSYKIYFWCCIKKHHLSHVAFESWFFKSFWHTVFSFKPIDLVMWIKIFLDL